MPSPVWCSLAPGAAAVEESLSVLRTPDLMPAEEEPAHSLGAVVELLLLIRVADTAHDKELAVGLFHYCGGQLRKALCGAGVHYDARLFVFRKIGLVVIIQRMLGVHEYQALIKSHARVGAQSVDIYFVKLG